MSNRWVRLASLLMAFMLVASLSMMRDGRLLGHTFQQSEQDAGVLRNLPNGGVVVNTTELCKDVAGYAGPVPLEITVVDGVIDSVHPLDNNETPGFFHRLVDAGLLEAWNGVRVDSVANMEVDGVTGATYSSRAVIDNVRAGAEYVANHNAVSFAGSVEWSIGIVAALVVALMAAILPFVVKKKWYRTTQELLNVAVLGFWTGTFVNYTMLLNFMSNGVHSLAALTGVVLLVMAFLYPLFGKSGHYCAWGCPLGSLQDLAGKCSKRKWRLGARAVRVLTWVRRCLWSVLIVCMWLGVWTSWIDYELFGAFVVESAPVVMLVVGGGVVLLSVVLPRPYCRFVCPTGTLLRMSQDVQSRGV